MKVTFTVHGVSETQVTRAVKVEDETLNAAVPCLEVELVTEAAHSGSLTLRFFGKDIPEAKALYVKDASIVADMS